MKNYILFLAALSLIFISCTSEEEGTNPPQELSGYCYVSGFGGLGELYKTSGNPQLDSWHYGEYSNLVYRFGVSPDIYFYTENEGGNAYFTPAITDPQYVDGTIAIGFNLISNEFSNSPTNSGISIAIIMAHEFAHCVDNKYSVYTTSSYRKELFADYLAGCYLYIKSLSVGSAYIEEVANTFFSLGSYDFNHPNFHGTPEQRRDCLMAGYNFIKQRTEAGQDSPLIDCVNAGYNYVSQM